MLSSAVPGSSPPLAKIGDVPPGPGNRSGRQVCACRMPFTGRIWPVERGNDKALTPHILCSSAVRVLPSQLLRRIEKTTPGTLPTGWKLRGPSLGNSRNARAVEAWSLEFVHVSLTSFQPSECLPANVILFK